MLAECRHRRSTWCIKEDCSVLFPTSFTYSIEYQAHGKDNIRQVHSQIWKSLSSPTTALSKERPATKWDMMLI